MFDKRVNLQKWSLKEGNILSKDEKLKNNGEQEITKNMKLLEDQAEEVAQNTEKVQQKD